MQNIVTGETNNPEVQLQQERDLEIRNAQTPPQTSQNPQDLETQLSPTAQQPPLDETGNQQTALTSEKPPQEDKNTEVGQPYQNQVIPEPLVPLTNVEAQPFTNNPNLINFPPDTFNWNQNRIDEITQGIAREPLPIEPGSVPYAFPNPSQQNITPDIGGRLQSAYEQTLRRQRQIATTRALQELVDYRPYNFTPPSTGLSEDPRVPGSNRSVLRNNPTQGDGEPEGNWLTGFASSWWEQNKQQFEILDSAIREVWQHVSGGATEPQREAMRELLAEYVFASPLMNAENNPNINSAQDVLPFIGQAFPRTSELLAEGVEMVFPATDVEDPSQFNPASGNFREFGRGATGAGLYGLSLPENILWASIYGVLDTARALAGDAGDNIPLLNQIPRDDDRSGFAYRYGQAFSGVDLDLVNVRDGSGNRYLALIPEGEDFETQLNWGAAAFAISTLLGNPVDDFLGAVRRTTPTLLEGIRRGQGFEEALEAARRLERINALRRARQTVPEFGRGSQARVVQEPDVPDVTQGQELTSGQNLTEVQESTQTPPLPTGIQQPTLLQGADAEEYQRLLTEAENAVSIYSPQFSEPLSHVYQPSALEVAQELTRTPTSPVPLPFFVPRSNNELLNLGQHLGDIPPSVTELTNQNLYTLQQIYGETYRRFGTPLEEVPPFIDAVVQFNRRRPPTVYRQLADLGISDEPTIGIAEVLVGRVIDPESDATLPLNILNQIRRQSSDTEVNALLDEYIANPTPELARQLNRELPIVIEDILGKEIFDSMNVGDATDDIVPADNILDGMPFITRNTREIRAQGWGEQYTDSELSTMLAYQSAYYTLINRLSREGTDPTTLQGDVAWLAGADPEETAQILNAAPGIGNHLQQIIENNEGVPGVYLRGREVSEERLQEFLQAHQPGRRVEYEAFTSVTTDEDVARQFSTQYQEVDESRTSVIFEIEGSPFEMPPIGQSEYLFGRNTSFEVISSEIGDDGIRIKLRQVEDLDSALSRADGLPNPPRSTENLVERVREELQPLYPDVNVDPIIRSLDEYGATSRGLQELEQQIDELRRLTINSGRRLNGDLAPYVRGNIADEIAQASIEGTVVEGVQARDLLPPITPNLEDISPLVTQTPWYHGTRQRDIMNISYLDGTPHEYGYGLYLSSSAEYAEIASVASRTVNNPIPGTTRLNPSGRGTVFQVTPEVRNPLNINDDLAFEEVRNVFKNAAESVFGKEFRRRYSEFLGDVPAQSWLQARDTYGEMFRAPMPERQYQEFSRRVNQGLRAAGFDGIYDAKRGILTALPDDAGRIPMSISPFKDNVGGGRKIEALHARHYLDAEVARSLPLRPAEANELQSRIGFEGAMMEELIRTYRGASQDTSNVVQELAENTKQARLEATALHESELKGLKQSAPEAALETPEFQQYRKAAENQDPCL